MRTTSALGLIVALLCYGCDDPEPPPTPKPPTAIPPPPTRPPTPVPDGAICKKLGYEGIGTYAEPCLVKESPITVKWTGNYAKSPSGETLPDFAFDNPLDGIVTNAILSIRYVDAKGKSLSVEFDGQKLERIELAGTIVRLSAKGKTFIPLGAPETATPKGTADIVCEIKSFGWTLPAPETFFKVSIAGQPSPSSRPTASASSSR
jgi:hypothetical protein